MHGETAIATTLPKQEPKIFAFWYAHVVPLLLVWFGLYYFFLLLFKANVAHALVSVSQHAAELEQHQARAAAAAEKLEGRGEVDLVAR